MRRAELSNKVAANKVVLCAPAETATSPKVLVVRRAAVALQVVVLALVQEVVVLAAAAVVALQVVLLALEEMVVLAAAANT